MTTATYITLARILLIPVFVGFAIYYTIGVRNQQPDENLRFAAIITFAVAAASDVVDGWVARHFNQRSRLGAILDPLADKLLLVAAVVTLTFCDWPVRPPLWFVIIVITREVLSIAGAFLVDHVAGKVSIHPHWTGKAATAFLITTAGLSMIGWERLMTGFAVIGCAFTFASGAIYIADSVRQMNDGEKETGKS